MTWEELTYGSWHPELLPALVVREAYGTRARDTDWMDGFYPYHEMDAYLGLIAIGLSVVGASGYRDRWVGFWVLLAGVGSLLMLGRFTFVFDHAHQVPIAGSSRIPVRFHLWVALAASALSAVGVDRLARADLGRVRLRGAALVVSLMVLASIPILAYLYEPVWSGSSRWSLPSHQARFDWLGRELLRGTIRTALLVAAAASISVWAARLKGESARRRCWLVSGLPLLVMVDLLAAHDADVPTISPTYWTVPPPTARKLRADRECRRIFGVAEKSSGEPGYASTPIDFFAVRDPLAWSLAPVWGLRSSAGETPIIARRFLAFSEHAAARSRFNIEGVTHLLTGHNMSSAFGPSEPVGSAYIYRNAEALPRARLVGKPVYVTGETEAIEAVEKLGAEIESRLVVEDPDRPLSPSATVEGTAHILRDEPERVDVQTDAPNDSYLTLADTFDPGWSATLDGRAVPIRPAWITFRAVFVPRGRHTLAFRYRPAGFSLGLGLSVLGLTLALACALHRRAGILLAPEHGSTRWYTGWPWFGIALWVAIVAGSIVAVGPAGVSIQQRWAHRFHRFTWGAGIEAIYEQHGTVKGVTPGSAR